MAFRVMSLPRPASACSAGASRVLYARAMFTRERPPSVKPGRLGIGGGDVAERVRWIRLFGTLSPETAAGLERAVHDAVAAGIRWLAVDVSELVAVAPAPLARAADAAAGPHSALVVCGADDGLLAELARAGVTATPTIDDVLRQAFLRPEEDRLASRFELEGLPYLRDPEEDSPEEDEPEQGERTGAASEEDDVDPQPGGEGEPAGDRAADDPVTGSRPA
jgi:hypothetical protein